MRIIILGAGVIGVTSAWALANAGHEVTVIDRQKGPAMETSHANAGQISPGYASPWAGPGVPLKALSWLLQKHPPLALRLDGSWAQLRWLWQMLGQCNAPSYAINKARMMRLAHYSRECLIQWRTQMGLGYDGRQRGTLQVFRTEKQWEASHKDIQVLQDLGVPYELLSPTQLTQAEPGLINSLHKLTGGLRLPLDETGDCQLFCEQLALVAQQAGVQFLFEQEVTALHIEKGRFKGVDVNTPRGAQQLFADAAVVALGSFSTPLLRSLWPEELPVYPVKGFSITAPLLDDALAPVSTVLDETYKVAITRFERRIRVGGMAHLVGFDLRLPEGPQHTLTHVLHDLFPNCGDTRQTSYWCGLRPMTPDGTPIVGPTPIQGLWLNTGHGTLGWTMSCGSAALLADLISGREPAIASDDLGLQRYRNATIQPHAHSSRIPTP